MTKNKKVILTFVAITVFVLLVIVLLIVLGKDKSYRMIKVFELDGVAKVTRAEKGDIDPYENMLLESGDTVKLEEGVMTLQMDDDKFAYVEEQTEFSLNATGSSENGRTTITVTKGSITNEIRNQLSAESSYEVNTPNSTMAVRGTVFRVSTYYDEAGVCYTKVSVFDGKVSSRLVYPDGRISDEEVSISAGKEVIIYEDGKTTDYLTDVTDIDYSNLPEDVISMLENILGITIDITTEEDEATTEESVQQSEPDSYVVTFIYSGKTFATQQVKAGECAVVPSLVPALSGDWKFDFTQPIHEDTKIIWEMN